MKVAITGSSGLIGSALVHALRDEGHRVLRLVRRDPNGDDEVRWDPRAATIDRDALEGVDAVVNLAGAGVGDRRWSESYKREVRDSRVHGTQTLVAALTELKQPPRVLLSGSAEGFYGDTGDDEVDESGPNGSGFLAGVVRDWEAATAPARDAGIRVVHLRTGLVLAPEGGLLGKLLPLFRLGLGGRLGNGRQWMSWISLPDHVAAVRFLMDRTEIDGPVNLTAPQPVTNKDFTTALGSAVNRPAALVVPSFALRAALGGFADEGALVSQRVVPRRLTEAGFTFQHPDIDVALAALLSTLKR